jgi:transglutaminase-like putative cysteine protease
MARTTIATDSARPRQRVAATALVALACTPLTAHMEPAVTTYVVLIVVWRLASLRWNGIEPRRWLLLPLTILGIANVLNAYHTLVGQDGGTALLATMLTLKLLELHGRRDVRAVTILFGFLLVSQFLFEQSAWLALYLAGLLVANVALMADLAATEHEPSVRGPLILAGRLTLQAVPLALVLFVLFPRLDAPLWDLGPGSERAYTGIKDSLEPGSISDLVLSGELAFRARFDGPVPPADNLYWRGRVVWTTDGRRWTGGASAIASHSPVPLRDAKEEVAYTVTLEPTGQRTLFALDMPVQVPTDAGMSAAFEVSAQGEIREARRYRLVSAMTYNTGDLVPDQRAAGLQLPTNVTPRMRRLVAGWQRGASSPQEVVRAALRHINREPFYYTLRPARLGANPADEFLFESRRGFCEHYASSFALLMRIAGIPSRIVLGYLGGELNPIGDYLMVRQSDAHAWVEVWLSGRGWVRVDPTAAVAPQRVEHSDLLEGLAAVRPARFQLGDRGLVGRWAHRLQLLADAVDAGWRNWVLDYSLARQQRLLEAVGLGVLREYGLALAMLVAGAIVLGLVTIAIGRRRAPLDPLERIYARFCRRLAANDLVRRPSEGPLRFSERVGGRRTELGDAVAAFMSLYLPLRYGRKTAGGSDLGELRRRLARVTLAIRKSHVRRVARRSTR